MTTDQKAVTNPPVVQPVHKWTAIGETKQGSDDNIAIKECKRSISDPEKSVFGKPIHVNKGVAFIGRLWKEVDQQNILFLPHDIKVALDKLQGELVNFISKKDFETLTAPIIKIAQTHHNWMEDLLSRSFALTSDRSILLKILSQPECEGIRFYLALKPSADEKEIDQPDGVFTFVCVGVSASGEDLYYSNDYQPKIPAYIADLENTSLCGEYPGQPVTIEEKDEKRRPAPLHPNLYRLYQHASELM